MVFLLATLAITAVFAQPGEANQVAGLVAEIVNKAKAGDAAYVAPKTEGYSKGAETNGAERAGTAGAAGHPTAREQKRILWP